MICDENIFWLVLWNMGFLFFQKTVGNFIMPNWQSHFFGRGYVPPPTSCVRGDHDSDMMGFSLTMESLVGDSWDMFFHQPMFECKGWVSINLLKTATLDEKLQGFPRLLTFDTLRVRKFATGNWDKSTRLLSGPFSLQLVGGIKQHENIIWYFKGSETIEWFTKLSFSPAFVKVVGGVSADYGHSICSRSVKRSQVRW